MSEYTRKDITLKTKIFITGFKEDKGKRAVNALTKDLKIQENDVLLIETDTRGCTGGHTNYLTVTNERNGFVKTNSSKMIMWMLNYALEFDEI